MYIHTGSPLCGAMKEKAVSFLARCGLDYDEAVTFSALLMEEGEILACASLCADVVKCVAVAPERQGEDLTAAVMTEVLRQAAREGRQHLMLYTKPRNQMLFTPFGFRPVIRTADVLLMENSPNGLETFLNGIKKPARGETAGCIVMNGDPFTLGHRHLAETAARECDRVYLFVLSEDGGAFSPRVRLQMAREGCGDLRNVTVHETGPYMVSAATFPTYFIKDKARAEDVRCGLDVRLFGERIAPALGITRRYVGEEPFCPVTAAYNRRMQELLPDCGVEVREIPRREACGVPVSASRVRELLQAGDLQAAGKLLPESTLRIIQSQGGK